MKAYENENPIEVLRSFLEIPLGSADGVFDRFLENSPGQFVVVKVWKDSCNVRGSRLNKVLLVAHADTYWDHEVRIRSRPNTEN